MYVHSASNDDDDVKANSTRIAVCPSSAAEKSCRKVIKRQILIDPVCRRVTVWTMSGQMTSSKRTAVVPTRTGRDWPVTGTGRSREYFGIGSHDVSTSMHRHTGSRDCLLLSALPPGCAFTCHCAHSWLKTNPHGMAQRDIGAARNEIKLRTMLKSELLLT